MSHLAATDHGTIIQPDRAALVANPDGSFSLLLPDVPEDSEASEGRLDRRHRDQIER
jgi:hypothetical protein